MLLPKILYEIDNFTKGKKKTAIPLGVISC